MVHASGSSQIGLARKNPDENRRNGNPPNEWPNKARYSCARCVSWLRLAVRSARVASLSALLGGGINLSSNRSAMKLRSCVAAADLARDEASFSICPSRQALRQEFAQRTNRILRGAEMRQGPRFATFWSKRCREVENHCFK
jgi:hypothetical protein